MSPYKNFINAAKAYFDSVPILKFLLSIYIVVFAVGGGLFLLGTFLGGFVNDFFTCIGVVIMLAGLLLTIIKEDAMVLAIVSGAIAVLSLIAWILALAGVGAGNYGAFVNALTSGYYSLSVFSFIPFFYFVVFGLIATFVFLKADKFKQMRAASAARAQTVGAPCPRCGSFVQMGAAFCPSCGAPNAAKQQYAPPVQPQYTPPVQPQYAPPAQPVQAEMVTPKCANCGADVTPGAAFCPKCGAKQ